MDIYSSHFHRCFISFSAFEFGYQMQHPNPSLSFQAHHYIYYANVHLLCAKIESNL